MCEKCGCSEHVHHDHSDPPEPIDLGRAILAKNDREAEHNRRHFTERGILALNLVSSPGAGKTTLLERTIRDLSRDYAIQVIEGDQATSLDADRIRAAGAAAHQINTGSGCHLDASMIHRALHRFEPKERSLLFIENVGNLVCPALFDLGERAKVVVASVTEGDDKPLKYPHMFRASEMVLLNKIDLLPYVAFDVAKFTSSVRQVNPKLEIISVSAISGAGLLHWYAWIGAAHARG